jgi:predicted negative regulator of RcsB-dependent stress response
MDEEIEIINTNTRVEKFKNFLISNRKQLITLLLIIVLLLIGFFGYQEFNKRSKEKLANKFNQIVTNFENGKKQNINNNLIEVIRTKDKTYSPLAFFFLLDNDLISSNQEINSYFDFLINEISLDKEIKNLTIYKKGLFNSDFVDENQLLDILNPVIKSESIWKPQAMYLMAEFYLAKNQKQKAKDFFEQVMIIENVSPKIKLEVQRRLRSEFGE